MITSDVGHVLRSASAAQTGHIQHGVIHMARILLLGAVLLAMAACAEVREIGLSALELPAVSNFALGKWRS